MRAVRRLPAVAVLALALVFAGAAGLVRVAAQDAASDNGLTVGQAEKLAANLRQGMTVDDVQKLLGKPQQTALQSDGGSPSLPSKGTLQWSYLWSNAGKSARLRVDFTAQPLEPYHVSSWEWIAQ
jgi:hypothetical protein